MNTNSHLIPGTHREIANLVEDLFHETEGPEDGQEAKG
jgi:hypothetical protein